MIKQDISENQVKLAYLGIGSNLGNKINNIEKTKFKLGLNGIKILQSSSYYESLSWPNSKNPKFLNIVLKINTNFTPTELLKTCKKIERAIGRKKTAINSPRECDIDILDYENRKISGEIFLPHPRMHIRNFVLFPLFELNKDWKHPVFKHHIKTLIFSLSNRDIRSIKQI
ncbi:MAG: 2-amino-4-hydroxy-6-hydroxymethyldihydropteridine diphosphokinase [Candidatus Pelagibacter sp.]